MLRFSKQIVNDSEFTASDFDTFDVETNMAIDEDGLMIMKAGSYTPTYTATEIQYLVDLQ